MSRVGKAILELITEIAGIQILVMQSLPNLSHSQSKLFVCFFFSVASLCPRWLNYCSVLNQRTFLNQTMNKSHFCSIHVV